MAGSLHGVNSATAAGGVSGFVSNLRQGFLESKIGQLFCKVLGIELKTTSMVRDIKTAVQTHSDAKVPTLALQNANVRGEATHTTTSAQVLKSNAPSTGQLFRDLQRDVTKFRSHVDGTVHNTSNVNPQVVLESLRREQAEARQLLTKLNALEKQGVKEGTPIADNELKNIGEQISQGLKSVRSKIIDLENAQPHVDFGNWKGDQFQARYQELKKNGLSGLNDEALQHIYKIAEGKFKDSLSLSPEAAIGQVGASSAQCVDLMEMCNKQLRHNENPNAAASAA